MRHDWPVKRALIYQFANQVKEKCNTSGNSLNPLGFQNENIGTALKMLLTRVISDAGQTWSHTFGINPK